MLYTLCVAWHQQLHKVLGGLIPVRPFNEHLINIFIVDVADGAFDKVAVGVDQHGRGTAQGAFTDFVPQPGQIIKITLNFRLRPGKSGGPDDATHCRWQRKIRNNGLQTFTIGGAVDFTADATAMRRVWHQHAITACKAQIRRERSTLVSAFFFNDLNEQNLTTMNDVLNFVPAA